MAQYGAEPIESDMKNIVELTESNFEREVLKHTNLVVVDFYAPWCGPCKMLAPMLEQFAGELAGTLKFGKLNVDDAPQLASRYGIKGVPTLILFDAGRQIEQAVGLGALQTLKSWITRAKAASPETPVAL